MLVKEFLKEIEKLRANNPNIDEMEIAPLFNGPTLMMTEGLEIIKNGGWNKQDAIGIIWTC